jgi:hypothetical protein
MDSLRRIFIEEIALEGPRGISWEFLITRVGEREKENPLSRSRSTKDLELVRDLLVSEGVIKCASNGNYILLDEESRLMILGTAHLPTVSGNPQAMRVLELIARAREKGCWSYSMCASLKIDSKQLFHLSNLLVEFKLIQRFSNVTIPRALRAHTAATHASFMILSRFAKPGSDPDVEDVLDPAHSSENVCSLILALLREAGGVMIASSLRLAVVTQGGFSSKQFRRGKAKLTTSRRIETFLIPKSDGLTDEEEEEDFDQDEDEEKVDLSRFVHAVRLLDAEFVPLVLEPTDEFMKSEEEDVQATPQESEPGELTTNLNPKLILLRSLLRSKLSFRESIVAIILGSGPEGVTTAEISNLTGVGLKEVLKALESIRTSPEIETIWRNDGRKKYNVYKARVGGQHPTILTDESALAVVPMPGGKTPRNSKGYVTDQTVRRSSIAQEIVSSRIALSLIDLGRAIEAHEQAQGIGIPGAQIDRRTLKKICALVNLPLVEKGDALSSKLVIVYDPSQTTPEEAMRRVDRPIGITPKGVLQVKPSLLTPSSVSSVESKQPLERRKLNLQEVMSKSRLAAMAVFGSAAKTSSFQQAQMYGLIKGGGEVYKAKLVHKFLLTVFGHGSSVGLQGMIDVMPLVLYLQVIGCGSTHPYLDSFISSKDAPVDVVFSELSADVKQHLRNSVPTTALSCTPEKALARTLVLLVKLSLLRWEKNSYLIQPEGGGVLGENIEMDRIRFDDGVAAEEFWNGLHAVCFAYRRRHGTGNVPPGMPGQLFRAQQWKCKIQVTLAQRRELEALLRQFQSRHSGDEVTVIDGSNEELVKLCLRTKLDVSAALRALKNLHALSDDTAKDKLFFASVYKARFSCPQCGQLFYQLTGIKRHFQHIHPDMEVPADIQDFTRTEYLGTVAKLRSRALGKRERQRRRRRHRRQTAPVNAETKYLQHALKLAKELVGSSQDEKVLYKVVGQIVGQESELVRMKLQALPEAPNVATGTTAAIKAEGAVCLIARLLVLNRLVDEDQPHVDSLCRQQGVERAEVDPVMKQWHQQGLLAYDKKGAYTLSRQGKLELFGKFSELDKFCEIIEACNKVDTQGIDSEDQLQGCVNAAVLERLIAQDNLLDCFFDETEMETPVDGEEGQDDSEDFMGIKRHIELAGPVSIDRVDVELANTVESRKETPVRTFVQELLKMHASSRSQVWRPNDRPVLDMDISASVSERKKWTVESIKNHYGISEIPDSALQNSHVNEFLKNLRACLGDVQVPKSHSMFDPFLESLIAVSPIVALIYSTDCDDFLGLGEEVPLSTWTTLDGDVKTNILADLLLHVLLLCNSFPGITADVIKKRLRLLPSHEVKFLVSILKDAHVVQMDHEGSLFINPVHQW